MPQPNISSSHRTTLRTMLVLTASVVAAAVMVACQPAVSTASAGATEAPSAAPSVMVAPVLQRAVETPVAHVGRVEAAQRVELRPRVAGHIEAVLFREGDIVRAGQPLFRIDPRPFDAALERARADLRLARAKETLAHSESDRAARLAAEQAIAEEEVERRAAAHAEAQARSAAAQAAVQAANLDREFAVIRAPIGGRIGRALVTAGNYVGAGASQTPLATLVGTAPLHVHFDVSEPALLGQLGGDRAAANWRAKIVDAHSARELAVAPIDFTDNEVSGAAGTLRLRARIDKPAAGLVPGQFVRVQLTAGEAQPALLVLDKAIGTDQGQRYVLVVKLDQTLEYRPVRVGAQQGDLRVVTSGLSANERVVVSGFMRVRPGMTVKPQPVAMEAASTAQSAATPSRQS
ncbi:Efflux pump periplasmic linker BepF [Burkholderiaceae bacterium]|nr:Efflux pump periplasmic linker BepF [Burkholderiaceae bacterium]